MTDDLTLIRQCPAYHFARTILEAQRPFRPAAKPAWRSSLAHLSNVVHTVYGARIDPATWAVAFADLGVRVSLDRKHQDIIAHVCGSHVVDWCPQTWGARALTDCYGAKFAHFSDLPAEATPAAPAKH